MTSDLSLSVVKLQLPRQLQSPSDHPKCLTLSLQLRLAVAGILTVSNILMLVAISTNYWIYGFDEKTGEMHAGLWKVCVKEVCMIHVSIKYSKVLLAVTIVFAICCNIVAVVALVFGVTNIKRRIAKVMFGEGLVALCAMAHATHYLSIDHVFQSFGYSLVLGWIGTVLYLVAALVSWIHYRREPDTAMTLDNIRQLVSESSKQEPSYT